MITESMKNEMDLSYLLDMFVHFDIQKTGFNNKTLEQILTTCINRNELQDETAQKMYDYLCEAMQHNSTLKNAVLISQSNCDGYSMNELIACTFRTEDGSMYVCYRGTGDGKWPDNAEGVVQKDSLMQRAASSYFDHVMKKYGASEDAHVIVTGHSKGGNLAQYTTMMSKYRERIDACYSMDGQGMSQKGIDSFKQQNGEEGYQKQVNKIYNICGENDYVNVLGIRIVRPDQKYLIRTPDAKGFGDYHNMYYMRTKDGYGLNWCYEEGEIVSVESGEIARFAEKLNAEMLERLSPEEYEDCSITLMSFLEMIFPDKGYPGGIYPVGTGKTKTATFEEVLGFMVHGGPLVLDTLLTTEEGKALLRKFFYDGLMDVYDKYGFSGAVAFVFVVEVVVVATVAIVIKNVVKIAAVTFVLTLVDSLFELIPGLKEAAVNFLHDLISFGVDTINSLRDWYDKNLNQGYIAATQNPEIRVDTNKLTQYAAQLEAVMKRVESLDRYMNALYTAVKLRDLGKVIGANYLVGGVNRLRNCRNYLNHTAQDFNEAEKYINDMMRY